MVNTDALLVIYRTPNDHTGGAFPTDSPTLPLDWWHFMLLMCTYNLYHIMHVWL